MNLTAEDLSNPVTAALFDAHLTIGMLLSGQHGDADPADLIQGAADALRDALEATKSQEPTRRH